MRPSLVITEKKVVNPLLIMATFEDWRALPHWQDGHLLGFLLVWSYGSDRIGLSGWVRSYRMPVG